MPLKGFTSSVKRVREPLIMSNHISLYAFQYHFEFELWRITLPFVVHLIQYLSLLLCLFYQVRDIKVSL